MSVRFLSCTGDRFPPLSPFQSFYEDDIKYERDMTVTYIIPAPPQPALPVIGLTALFPVRRIFCIGRNYAAHTREMGGDPTREPPFFFQKAADTIDLCPPDAVVDHPYPPMTSSYHFEGELVVALKQGGRDIATTHARYHIFGYAAGLDMTRRDLQDEAKQLRRPWEISKSADHSAPIGPIHPVETVGHLEKGALRVSVNDVIKQNADLADMIWSIPEQISILSRFFELKAGDLIFTGTPEGVGPVTRGDQLTTHIAGLAPISLRIV